MRADLPASTTPGNVSLPPPPTALSSECHSLAGAGNSRHFGDSEKSRMHWKSTGIAGEVSQQVLAVADLASRGLFKFHLETPQGKPQQSGPERARVTLLPRKQQAKLTDTNEQTNRSPRALWEKGRPGFSSTAAWLCESSVRRL